MEYPRKGPGYSEEHTHIWGYNACRCEDQNPCPGEISITEDDYCAPTPPPTEPPQCPPYIHASFVTPTKCFYTHCPSRPMGIDAARNWCREKGGELASIHTAYEAENIHAMLKTPEGERFKAWIGAKRVDATDANTPEGWVWEDGSDWITPTWPNDGLDDVSNADKNRIAIVEDGTWTEYEDGEWPHFFGVVCQTIPQLVGQITHLAAVDFKCPYDHKDRLFKLKDSTLEKCEMACKADAACNFFSFVEDKSICHGCSVADNIEPREGAKLYQIGFVTAREDQDELVAR